MKENKKKNNCPNCGAPIEHFFNYQCRYCGTFLHNTNEKIKEFNNCDIKVTNVDIERYIHTMNYIITITGWSTPKVMWYEEGINNFIASGEDIAKRVGYRIEVPFEYFKDLTPDRLIDYIIRSLPRIFEENQYIIIEKVLDKFYRIGKIT
jgi:hypothetical protein